MQKSILLKSALITVLVLSFLLFPALEAEALTQEEEPSFYAEALYTDVDDLDSDLGFLLGGEQKVRDNISMAGEYMRVTGEGDINSDELDYRLHGFRVKGLLNITDEMAPDRAGLDINLHGSIGYYDLELENGDDDSDSDFGFTLGAGFNYDLEDDIELRGNAGYRFVDFDDLEDPNSGDEDDIDAGGYEISLGLGIPF
ncbi:outer membrane beta-barrel protein [Halarsenatibacter silvermanii]|uniref:Opacity protein n=1 Tax=Halarsenatibacter silvermanii TaxID=321763 RepID=A0A1G9HBF2_9FIRM|nr:outer membrane beta-barrel protein [Halarsenatibacter silvermanii]SDL10348.1 Opacity protein [Halarsenatibacter silvermanii]